MSSFDVNNKCADGVFDNLGDFIRAHYGEKFKWRRYRRMFTPYEEQKAFMDESVYECLYAQTGELIECAALADGDYLLGFRKEWEVGDKIAANVEYCKLSEIRLERDMENNGT